jgi:hypothetical protein
MKTKQMAIAILMLLSISACKKDDTNNNTPATYNLSGNAVGNQEVPSVTEMEPEL